jgi:sodium/potassium-transporting ATPase subunit alpha
MAGPKYYDPKDGDISDLEMDEKQAQIRFENESTHGPTDERQGREKITRRLSRRGSSTAGSRRRSNSAANAGFPLEFRTLSIAVSESKQRPDESDRDDKLDTERDYFASLHFHTSNRDEVLKSFEVTEKGGLGDELAASRLARDGKNTLPKARESYYRKLFWYLFGGFCSVLWFAVIVFFLCWKPLSTPPSIPNLAMAIMVIFVIVLQASFSAFQDWSTKRVMNSILDLLPAEAMVIRNGTASKISATELVVGDIVQIAIGNKVPADLLLLSTSGDIRFDRSVLTGEPDEIEGSIECTNESFLETRNIALMGTNVTNGNGIGVVLLIGTNSVMGRIASVTTGVKSKPTLIQQGKSQSNECPFLESTLGDSL